VGEWLRHRPGGVGVRSERPCVTGPWGRRRRGTRSPARSRERSWGVQKSVHRSTKMVSRSCFGAFVYTVAALRTGVVTQECTQIGENGTSEPFWAICVHCCDASCVGWHERPNCHGVPAVPPRCSASPLAGKTGSARVAPPLGWRLHRGINPHKSPKSHFFCNLLV